MPGSKSITNRAYVLAAIAAGETFVREPLESRDATLMLGALDALGARHGRQPGGVRILPIGPAGDTGPVHVDLGNAGTVARFTPALAALGSRTVHFDGDEAIRNRPLAPLLEALSTLGARIEHGGRAAPPLTVHGGGLRGGTVELDSSASSQFLSALLLAGPAFPDGITVRLVGDAPPSEPHIAMTLQLLREFGAAPERNRSQFHVPHQRLHRAEYRVEPDLSTAAPFAMAPLVAGGSVRIDGWPAETTQPGDWLREVLARLGGTVTLDRAGLTVTGSGRIQGAELDLHEVGELTPVIAAALCLASGPSTISGVAHLRGHETDRLAALAGELSGLGAEVTETADGLRIVPGRLHGGEFHTYDDHRLVMAAAVLGLAVPGIIVQNPATVGKTFPGFTEAWTDLIG